MAQPHGVVDPDPRVLVRIGLCALGFGLLVYLVDRPAGHAALIPAAWSWRGHSPVFGAIGGWLPSLLHPLAFSLLSAAVMARPAATAGRVCLAWWTVGIVAELVQHPLLSAPLAAAWGSIPVLDLVARYAQRGRFDIADLAATTAGALAAAALLHLRPIQEPAHAP